MRQGVYAMVGGPNYETVAELKMLKNLKVDSVGTFTLKYVKNIQIFKGSNVCGSNV